MKLPLTLFVPVMFAPGAALTVSLSVAELLAGFGSVVPTAVLTVAVLLIVPVAAAEIPHVARYVVLPPVCRLTISLMLPLPDAGHVPPPHRDLAGTVPL